MTASDPSTRSSVAQPRGLDAALELVARLVAPLPAADVALDDAHGLVTAEPVRAAADAPPFANAAMDGVAVRAADTAGAPVALAPRGEARAGSPARAPLGAAEAMEISTGAALPEGADAVVRRERLERADGAIRVLEAVAAGTDVRAAGEDATVGEELLGAGAVLTAGALAALAAAGVARVACRPAPRVALLVTGDEIVLRGGAGRAGGVPDVNGIALGALLRELGGEVVLVRHLGDDAAALTGALAAALAEADLVVVAGGMAKGRHDHATAAFAAAGLTTHVAGLDLRPGRPGRFATAPGGSAVVGVPGNPAAAFVVARLLGGAVLRALRGQPPERHERLPLAAPAEPHPSCVSALRARVADGAVVVLDRQGAHQASSLAHADVLALLPPAGGPLTAGTTVDVARL